MIVKKPNNKPLIIVVVVIVLCLFCGAIYFVGGISATTSPIRQYKFDGSANQLKKGLYNQLKSDTTLKYEDEEIWGNEKDGYSYRATIDLRKNDICNKYTIRYEDEKNGTRFSLISAFDKGYKHGGYGIKAIGIKPLINQFETNILIPLKTVQKINLVRDTSFWSNFSIY